MKFFQHQNRELGKLSNQEKHKFYLQELFEGHTYVRKYLILLTILFMLGNVPLVFLQTRTGESMPPFVRYLSWVSIFVSMICYLISFFVRINQESPKFITTPSILLFLANLSALFCLICQTYWFLAHAKMSSDISVVIEGISISATGIYLAKLGDLLNPLWYFKIIMPCGYFVGWIIGSLQIKDYSTAVIWISCSFGIVNVILITALHALFRWNLFVKKIDNETWNAIHKLILNKVPSPIVVLSIKGEVVYANPEFKKLSNEDIDLFAKKVRNLKKRKEYKEEYEEDKETINTSPRFPFGIQRCQTSKSNFNSEIRDQILIDSDREIVDLAELLQNVQKLLQMGQIKDEDYFIYDGKTMNDPENQNDQSFEVTLSFMVESEKIILIFRNTTDHARLVKLESNNQYKDKLLASVSHELRTPLNGNLSLIEAALNHDNIPFNLKEQFLIPAYRSGKLLLYLINDILDYSQIVAKKLRLNFKNASIIETIQSCYQLVDLQAKRKRIDLKLSIDEKLSYFNTDHDRLRQIILNLLSNAVKFTFNGNILLSAKIKEPSLIKISVKDTGIGMKAEDLKKLFKEFTRIRDADQVNLNAKGVGLGLTIANQLAKRLGPSTNPQGIKVKSEYGVGSCFSLVIDDKSKEFKASKRDINTITDEVPQTDTIDNFGSLNFSLIDINEKIDIKMTEYETKTGRLLKSHNQISSFAGTGSHISQQLQTIKKKLLIVDDEPFNILAIESILSPDFIIETTFNGKDAINKVTQASKNNQCYDLILMDCQMPIMDGYETTKVLKGMMNRKELSLIPIVGCTAFSGDEALNRCFEVGMVKVLEKPLSKAKLNQIIKAILNQNSNSS